MPISHACFGLYCVYYTAFGYQGQGRINLLQTCAFTPDNLTLDALFSAPYNKHTNTLLERRHCSMAWMIVSDSSCEIRELERPAAGVQFALVPFKIRIGERESCRPAHVERSAYATGYDRLQRRPAPAPAPARKNGPSIFCKRTTSLPSPSAATFRAVTTQHFRPGKWCWKSIPKRRSSFWTR